MRGNQLLANAILLDSETTSLKRQSGIIEVATYNLKDKKVTEYLLKPQLVIASQHIGGQDVTRLTSSSMDVHQIVSGIHGWRDLLAAQAHFEYGVSRSDTKAVEKALEINNYYAWKNMGGAGFMTDPNRVIKFPHMLGQVESAQATYERKVKMGLDKVYDLGKHISMQELLAPGSEFTESLKGKTVWIANAPFECLGADTLVELADGSIVELQDVAEGSAIGGTSPIDAPYREFSIVETSAPINKGLRASYLVKPMYGMPTKASAKHLWLTQRGWVETQDLTTDDWLLRSLNKLDIPDSGLFSQEELELVGWFIAEGLLKEFPQEILRCSNRELGFVLHEIYAPGGNVLWTTSKRLSEQLVLIWGRFGIPALWESNNELSFKVTIPTITQEYPDFIWTPIVKIEPIGEIEVWDVETSSQELIANGLVVHNSKQFGAQIGGMRAAGQSIGLDGIFETRSAISPDPFYVTGIEVNAARAYSQISGDWTETWKAYVKHTPKAGESAVRDVQDVTRAFMSYGRKLGLTKASNEYFGTGVDLTYRLFGSLDQDPTKALEALKTKEVHRAAEDVTVSESLVLERAVKYTSALQEASEGTTVGKQLLEEAAQGKGLLSEAAQYFARIDYVTGEIQRTNLVKRLTRAQEDILTQGKTYQTLGAYDTMGISSITASGDEVDVSIAKTAKQEFDNMDDVVQFLTKQKSYSQSAHTPEQIWKRLEKHVAVTGKDGLGEFERLETQTTIGGEDVGSVEAKVIADADHIMGLKNKYLDDLVSGKRGAHLLEKAAAYASTNMWGKVGAGVATAAAALTATGAIWQAMNGRHERFNENSPSIVSYNFREWQQKQSQFYGTRPALTTMDGLAPTGIAEQKRAQATDFGSPYKGPSVSLGILANQDELEKEREKWVRSQYGAGQAKGGVTNPYEALGGFMPKSNAFIQGATFTPYNGELGLRGNLMTLNLTKGGWKVTAEDADTITVKRGGLRGAVASFFGLNRGYTFRMAGVDAPEVSHGSESFHAPQPGADDAAVAYRNLLKGAHNLSLVFNPADASYGRMLGAVIADGKNLNFETVKMGITAHLPFGKAEEEMIDRGVFKAAEDQAFRAGRGIWAHPWAQIYHDFSEASGSRITFNTFSRRERIAENNTEMRLITLMETAEAQGFASNVNRMQALELAHNFDYNSDFVKPHIFDVSVSPQGAYQQNLMLDASDYMRTKGTGEQPNKYSRRGGYGELDSTMVLDSMSSTNSVWNKRKLQAFESYNVEDRARRERKERMMQEQQRINQQFGVSPINHYRM
jgi:endonuclease YncB( thermonuclease family)